MRLQIVILIAASLVVAKAQNDPEESDLSKEVAANGLDNAIIYEVNDSGLLSSDVTTRFRRSIFPGTLATNQEFLNNLLKLLNDYDRWQLRTPIVFSTKPSSDPLKNSKIRLSGTNDDALEGPDTKILIGTKPLIEMENNPSGNVMRSDSLGVTRRDGLKVLRLKKDEMEKTRSGKYQPLVRRDGLKVLRLRRSEPYKQLENNELKDRSGSLKLLRLRRAQNCLDDGSCEAED